MRANCDTERGTLITLITAGLAKNKTLTTLHASNIGCSDAGFRAFSDALAVMLLLLLLLLRLSATGSDVSMLHHCRLWRT